MIATDQTVPAEGVDVPLPDLKERINALLWMTLPPGCTLGRAEALACRIYDDILRHWRADSDERAADREGPP